MYCFCSQYLYHCLHCIRWAAGKCLDYDTLALQHRLIVYMGHWFQPEDCSAAVNLYIDSNQASLVSLETDLLSACSLAALDSAVWQECPFFLLYSKRSHFFSCLISTSSSLLNLVLCKEFHLTFQWSPSSASSYIRLEHLRNAHLSFVWASQSSFWEYWPLTQASFVNILP